VTSSVKGGDKGRMGDDARMQLASGDPLGNWGYKGRQTWGGASHLKECLCGKLVSGKKGDNWN